MLNLRSTPFDFQQQNKLSLQAPAFDGASHNNTMIPQIQQQQLSQYCQSSSLMAGQNSLRNSQGQPHFLTPQRPAMPRLMSDHGFTEFNVRNQNGMNPAQSRPQQPRQSTDIQNSHSFQKSINVNHRSSIKNHKSCFDFSQPAANKVQTGYEVCSDQGNLNASFSTRISTSSDSEDAEEQAANIIKQSEQLSKTNSVAVTTASSIHMSEDICLKNNISMPQQSVDFVQKSANQKTIVAQTTPDEWKNKIKTELCKYWLKSQPCENLVKDQGCGFAHGEAQLQPKKGLNKQYLTSVCKNFIDSPEKCTYGHRCIFQHPSLNVNKRQDYRDMMEDNVRYTAMRMFQNIEGAETLYINTYALKTPRLSCFKSITQVAKRENQDSEQ